MDKQTALPPEIKNAVHKSGDNLNPANYRPISLTCKATQDLEHTNHMVSSQPRESSDNTDDVSIPRLVENFLQPIRRAMQIWVMTRHQYGFSDVISQGNQ